MTNLRTAAQQALEALENGKRVRAYEGGTKCQISLEDSAITALRAALSEARLHEVAVHCEQVERRLRAVNTAAMKLTSDLTCMDVDADDRLSRDRVMERVMQWRNEWDKAMFEEEKPNDHHHH